MNFIATIFVFVFVAAAVSGYSPSVVYNTKYINSNGEDVCFYNKVQIAPSKTVEDVGKCRELTCDANFSVMISKCFEDPYGKCHYDGVDYSLPFPDCCGVKSCT